MSYHGDIRLGETIDIKFTTRRFSTGAPHTLAGTPAVSAYVGNGTTEITAGITLTVDFDSRTGLNNVRVVATSGNGFATATNVQLVITAGTVDSVSVVGEVVGEFSIENRSALMPTPAGRTLAVEADGMAHADVKEWLGTAPLALASQRVVTDVGAISGDATAADNLETMLDGTGGQTLMLKSLVINNPSGVAVDIDGSTSAVLIDAANGYGVNIGSTDVSLFCHSTGNYGVYFSGGTDRAGLRLAGNGTGPGAQLEGGATGAGAKLTGAIASELVGLSGQAIKASGSSGQPAVELIGTAAPGLYISTTAGNSVTLIGAVTWPANFDAEVQSELADEMEARGYTSTVSGRIDASISTRLAAASYTAPDNASIAAILADTGTDGVVVAPASKSGYALSATGLDAIPTTAPSGVAATFREMIVQTWRRWFKKTHYDIAGNSIKTYADNGTTVLTTQTTSVSGTDEDVGAAT